MRAETGAMCFGDDWNGVFIRGDNAIGLVLNLKGYLADPTGPFCGNAVRQIIELLECSDQRTKEGVQKLKPFEECIK